jgi:hypothetical protein
VDSVERIFNIKYFSTISLREVHGDVFNCPTMCQENMNIRNPKQEGKGNSFTKFLRSTSGITLREK